MPGGDHLRGALPGGGLPGGGLPGGGLPGGGLPGSAASEAQPGQDVEGRHTSPQIENFTYHPTSHTAFILFINYKALFTTKKFI